jgi:transposase
MTKLNISFIEIIKNIIFTNKKLKYNYTKNYPNSKYLLDTIISDILYILKTGISWRDSRSSINWHTLYWHFKRFSENRVFEQLFKSLRKGYIYNHSINVQIVDSTFIMNKFGKNKIERNKFFKNKNCNKISLVTDINGVPLSVLLNTGNVHDLSFINGHVNALFILSRKYCDKSVSLLADKGYVSSKLKKSLCSRNYNLIYPAKINMKPDATFDKTLYKKRINVEHSFAKLKLFKRIQLRYDSDYTTYLSFIYLACSQMIYRNIYQ